MSPHWLLTLIPAMVSFTSVHRWNSLLCPPLGFLFNFALLWLILRRTPKEMRVHSRILMQTCATDCLLLIVQCIGQIAFTFDRKTSSFVQFSDGYFVLVFGEISPTFQLYLICIWFFFHTLSLTGISVLFLCRYLVLNRNAKITLRPYFVFLLCPMLYICAMNAIQFMGLNGTLNQQPLDKKLFEPFVDFDQQPLYGTAEFKEDNHLLLLAFRLNALLLILTYTTIFFCGWQMVRFVSKNAMLGGRLKELNRQLTKCLIIMACLPLCIGTPFLFFMSSDTSFLSKNNIGGENNWHLEWELYFLLACHWLPVLNPLTTIYTNRPYRNALLRRFVKISPTAHVVAA